MSRADTWRQRVYDSEQAWKSGHLRVENRDGREVNKKVSVEDAQFMYDRLSEHFEIRPVKIVVNRRLRQWAGWYMKHGRSGDRSPRIEVRRSIFEYKTMLHEFAHHLDAERDDNDGKGHGGSFAQAMLDVVETHLGRETMSDLLRLYENYGVPIGADEARKAVARARDGVKKRQQRHGEIADAWAIKLTRTYRDALGQALSDEVFFLDQNKSDITRVLDRAGVWKRKGTVEKIKERHEEFLDDDWKVEIVKVRAELDTLYSNRWWAIEEISGKE